MPSITALRRYPVKAMGGESPDALELDARGAVGDRWYAVLDGEDKMATFKHSTRFRRYDGMETFSAATEDDGVWVGHTSGGRWHVDDPVLSDALTEVLGAPVRVAAEAATPHFDACAISLVGTATLDWCREHLGVDADPRRLRPNLVIATSTPFEEESWTTVSSGEVSLRAVERIERCRTIDLAQDGVTGSTRWLKPLGEARDTCVGVYFEVASSGRLETGAALSVR